MWMLEKLESGLDLLLAGIAGAFVGLWMYTEIKTAKQKIYFTMCGGLSSFYAAPYLAEYFHITGDGARTFFGFAIGIFGAAMLQAVKRAIDATDLWEVIKARFNIGKGEPK